ncbi:MAG: ABC transporter permease [Armatimonadetes bacterium]|nr:ABC transporter permease [Armatimonadota bacterium]
MSILTRKLVRDWIASGWQYIAITVTVMLGITFFNAAYSAYVNLDSSYSGSYRQLRFEDFGVSFNAAPRRVAERIQKVPGVAAVEARLVEDVGLELPNRGNLKLVGRLISVPAGRPATVDDLNIVEGRTLVKATAREILLEAAFAKYHKLVPGDFVVAVRGASRVKLQVAGIVQSPEYLYVVRSKQELMAMPSTFGVMFVSEDVLGPLVEKSGEVDEVKVRIAKDADLKATMRRTKEALHVYKPEDPVSYKDQPGYQMLQQDLSGFQAYATLFPAFFLGVAFLSVYTLMMRMVSQQRTAIGLLRSLGLSRWEVLWHYLSGALVLGIVASLLGDLAGIWFAQWISHLYMRMLQVPFKEIIPRYDVLGVGLIVGVVTCGLAGVFPSLAAARIRPAEAMRPEIPTFGASSLMLDRLLPSVRLLWRIPLRNVFRQPKRTLSTLFGIVAGMALMMTAKGLLDSSETAMDQIVSGSYHYGLRVDFIRYQSNDVVERVRSWPGVRYAEGALELPLEIRHGTKTYSAMVSGLPDGQRLRSLVDFDGQAISVPVEGAIFGPTLRKRLNLELGDQVDLSLPEQLTAEKSSHRTIRVAGFNDEAMGTVMYCRRDSVERMFRRDLELPPNAITGIALVCDPSYQQVVKQRLENLSDAGSVLSRADISILVHDMMKTMRIFVWIMEIFGVFLAFAVIFNMVSINVLERSTEVATLRTIGVSRSQISWLITIENLAVSLLGMAIGLPFGRWFVGAFWRASQSPEQEDLFSFKIAIHSSTYLWTCIAVLVVAVVSTVPSLLRLNRMDLAKSTKERAAG